MLLITAAGLLLLLLLAGMSTVSKVMHRLPSSAARHANQWEGRTAWPHSKAKHGVNTAVVCPRNAALVAVDRFSPHACAAVARKFQVPNSSPASITALSGARALLLLLLVVALALLLLLSSVVLLLLPCNRGSRLPSRAGPVSALPLPLLLLLVPLVPLGLNSNGSSCCLLVCPRLLVVLLLLLPKGASMLSSSVGSSSSHCFLSCSSRSRSSCSSRSSCCRRWCCLYRSIAKVVADAMISAVAEMTVRWAVSTCTEMIGKTSRCSRSQQRRQQTFRQAGSHDTATMVLQPKLRLLVVAVLVLLSAWIVELLGHDHRPTNCGACKQASRQACLCLT